MFRINRVIAQVARFSLFCRFIPFMSFLWKGLIIPVWIILLTEKAVSFNLKDLSHRNSLQKKEIDPSLLENFKVITHKLMTDKNQNI